MVTKSCGDFVGICKVRAVFSARAKSGKGVSGRKRVGRVLVRLFWVGNMARSFSWIICERERVFCACVSITASIISSEDKNAT